MRRHNRWPWVAGMLCALSSTGVRAQTQATLEAPESVPAGSTVKVQWQGPRGDYDKVAVVPYGAPDNETRVPAAFVRLGNPAVFTLPEKSG